MSIINLLMGIGLLILLMCAVAAGWYLNEMITTFHARRKRR